MRRLLIFVLAIVVMSLSVFSLVACSSTPPVQQDSGLED